MATKNISITAEEMEARITHAVRCLSRKKFTENNSNNSLLMAKFPTKPSVPNPVTNFSSMISVKISPKRNDLMSDKSLKMGLLSGLI